MYMFEIWDRHTDRQTDKQTDTTVYRVAPQLKKEIHDWNRNVENIRGALKSCKAGKSQLKMSKTKLETEIRKFEQGRQKEKKKLHQCPLNLKMKMLMQI